MKEQEKINHCFTKSYLLFIHNADTSLSGSTDKICCSKSQTVVIVMVTVLDQVIEVVRPKTWLIIIDTQFLKKSKVISMPLCSINIILV